MSNILITIENTYEFMIQKDHYGFEHIRFADVVPDWLIDIIQRVNFMEFNNPKELIKMVKKTIQTEKFAAVTYNYYRKSSTGDITIKFIEEKDNDVSATT